MAVEKCYHYMCYEEICCFLSTGKVYISVSFNAIVSMLCVCQASELLVLNLGLLITNHSHPHRRHTFHLYFVSFSRNSLQFGFFDNNFQSKVFIEISLRSGNTHHRVSESLPLKTENSSVTYCLILKANALNLRYT